MRVRSFRGVIVLSTVAVMTTAMVLVAILLEPELVDRGLSIAGM